MLFCASCKKELQDDDVRLLQRRDTCHHCGMDLHTCINCRFWDANASLCREGLGDFIRDREKANFCSHHLRRHSAWANFRKFTVKL